MKKTHAELELEAKLQLEADLQTARTERDTAQSGWDDCGKQLREVQTDYGQVADEVKDLDVQIGQLQGHLEVANKVAAHCKRERDEARALLDAERDARLTQSLGEQERATALTKLCNAFNITEFSQLIPRVAQTHSECTKQLQDLHAEKEGWRKKAGDLEFQLDGRAESAEKRELAVKDARIAELEAIPSTDKERNPWLEERLIALQRAANATCWIDAIDAAQRSLTKAHGPSGSELTVAQEKIAQLEEQALNFAIQHDNAWRDRQVVVERLQSESCFQADLRRIELEAERAGATARAQALQAEVEKTYRLLRTEWRKVSELEAKVRKMPKAPEAKASES